MACAAAVATLNLFKQENLFERASDMGKVLGIAMHAAFKGLPNVIGIRTLGLAGAVELSGVAGLPGKRGYDIFLECFHKGARIRPAGETLVLAPPLSSTNRILTNWLAPWPTRLRSTPDRQLRAREARSP